MNIGKAERRLKQDSRKACMIDTGFDSMVKRLDDEGIFQRKQRGHVVSLYREKGFGFIRSMGVNYYMKLRRLSNADQLHKGDAVTFTIQRGGDRVDKILTINNK